MLRQVYQPAGAVFIGRMEKRYDLFRISKKDKECI